MHSDFYTTLSPHQSLKAKRILKDKDLFELMFNCRDELNTLLDDGLYEIIENKRHKLIIETLKNGGYYQTVYASLSQLIALSIGIKWYNRPEKHKEDAVMELINRYYGLSISKRHWKPIIREKRPTVKRKQKYTKKIKYTDTTLLLSPL